MVKKIKKKAKTTFSKFWTEIILTISLIDIQICFLLCFLDKIQVAENLATAIVTQVVGVFFVYSTKAYFETKEEENMKYKRDRFEINNNDEAQG